jgi:hypothetical protein
MRTMYSAGAVFALALVWLCIWLGLHIGIYEPLYSERTIVPPVSVLVALHWLSVAASLVLLLISSLRIRESKTRATESSKALEMFTYISLILIVLLLVILGGRICMSIIVGIVK